MSTDSDGWEVIGKQVTHHGDPKLTVYSNGGGYVNAAADRELLDRPEACRVLVDAEANRIALEPTDADDADGYSVSRENRHEAGGDVRLVSALQRLGLDLDKLDESMFLTLEAEGDLVVADCDPLFAATRTGDRDLDATTTAADENDEDEEYPCSHDDCDFTSDSERGRNIHEARSHEDEDDQEEEVGEELTPDDVELPGSLTEHDVHAVADFLTSVEAVANDFEVSEERAERILRAHGCLDEVTE